MKILKQEIKHEKLKLLKILKFKERRKKSINHKFRNFLKILYHIQQYNKQNRGFSKR